jgi:hypothetical protein
VVSGVATGDEPQGVDRLLGEIRRWAADTRASEAAGARSRQRWLQRQAEEEKTLAAIALDLTERGETVVVKTTSGRAHRGALVGVAGDVWVLRSDPSGVTFVAADAVSSLRAQPGGDNRPTPVAAEARPAPLAASMAEMLSDLATERPRVRVVIQGEPEVVVGELRWVGVDVVTVAVAGDPPATVYVRLGSVSELSVLGSG